MPCYTGCARSTPTRSSLWAGAISFLLVISSLAYAQESSTGNISGTVTGPRGASVSGAEITITQRLSGQLTRTTTSPAGTYAVRDLIPGDYVLHVEAKGFQPAELLINPGHVVEPAAGRCRAVVGSRGTPGRSDRRASGGRGRERHDGAS